MPCTSPVQYAQEVEPSSGRAHSLYRKTQFLLVTPSSSPSTFTFPLRVYRYQETGPGLLDRTASSAVQYGYTGMEVWTWRAHCISSLAL